MKLTRNLALSACLVGAAVAAPVEQSYGYALATFWVTGLVLGTTVMNCLRAAAGIDIFYGLYKFVGLHPVEGLFLLGAGVMVASDENPEVLTFQNANEEAAREIGLSEDERTHYNYELARINLAFDELNGQLTEMKLPTDHEKVNQKQLDQSWQAVAKDLQLSLQTQSAVRKIILASVRPNQPSNR